MNISQSEARSEGIRFSAQDDSGKEVARAFLYLMYNDLHKEPFGLLEDVEVDGSMRGQGIGTELVKSVIDAARERGCYKLIATSRHARPKVHELYERIGFENHGIEFRINFS